MNEPDLSPVPWVVATCFPIGDSRDCLFILDANKNEVCRLPVGVVDAKHQWNASVMKSAPEMFDLIRDLVVSYALKGSLPHDLLVRAEKIIGEIYARRREEYGAK